MEYDRILILLRFGVWRLDSYPEELWIGEFCMRAAVRRVATAHSIKPREPPESFLFGFSGPGAWEEARRLGSEVIWIQPLPSNEG